MGDTAAMGTACVSARKLVIAGAFTIAATIPSIAPLLLTPADLSAQQSGCANGEEGDLYSGVCVPYLVPNSQATGGGIEIPQPGMPGPLPPSQEEQDLADVVTPGY
jgi:hypothetical protein